MEFRREHGATIISLSDAEASVFAMVLKRATFEDTPTERQNEILDFALAMLRRLESPD